MTRPEYALLTAGEEHGLMLQYRKKPTRAIEDRLVRSQLRLVAKLAHEYSDDPETVAELTQEGALGLVVAVRRFDPERGVRLATYAGWWIRAYQLRWLVHNHRLVRMGTTAGQRRVFFNARGLRNKLESAGLPADAEEMARRLGVDAATVGETLQRMDRDEVSLDQPAVGEGPLRIDRMADAGAPPDEVAERAERRFIMAREAERFRDGLRGRDRSLFESRWLAETPETLAHVGERFGVSRERARQLEDRLLERLRGRLPDGLADAA